MFFCFFISNNARANELAHLEMIGAIVHQLTRNLSEDEIKKSGFDTYFVDHTAGVYPASAAGVPYTAAYMQSKGDMITDLHEDLAAEQKHGRPTTTFCVWSTIRTSVIRLNSCVSVRLSIIKDLERDFDLQPIK